MAVSAHALQWPEIANWPELIKNMRVKQFENLPFSRPVKVAILDNGFDDWEKEKGKRLPTLKVDYEDGPVTKANDRKRTPMHGTLMAILLAGLIEKSGVVPNYELRLINSSGIQKFEAAVDLVIREKFDIVLYAQTWELDDSENQDGYINKIVNRAVSSGIVWINAAGAFRKSTYSSHLEFEGDRVIFKNRSGKNSTELTLRCLASPSEKCPLSLTLTWNQFKDRPNAGSEKDLDLFLYDSKGKKVIASSEMMQVPTGAKPNAKIAPNPIELIDGMNIAPGEYKIRVSDLSHNFDPQKDTFKLTIHDPSLELDTGDNSETLFPPANNPGVIVIGASDDVNSSFSKKYKLPRINLKSLVQLASSAKSSGDERQPLSTSPASALAAAYAVLQMGVYNVDKGQIQRALLSLSDTDFDGAKFIDFSGGNQTGSDKVRNEKSPQRPAEGKPQRAPAAAPNPAPRIHVRVVPNPDIPPCAIPAQIVPRSVAVGDLLTFGRGYAVRVEGRLAISVPYNFGRLQNLPPLPTPDHRYFMTNLGPRIALPEEAESLAPEVYEVFPTLTLCR